MLTVFASMDEAFRVRRGSGDHTISSGSIVDWHLQDGEAGTRSETGTRSPTDSCSATWCWPDRATSRCTSPDYGFISPGIRCINFPTVQSARFHGNHDRDDGFFKSNPVDGQKPRHYQQTVYKDSGKGIFFFFLCVISIVTTYVSFQSMSETVVITAWNNWCWFIS